MGRPLPPQAPLSPPPTPTPLALALPRFAEDPQVKLAVAFALAQSTKLRWAAAPGAPNAHRVAASGGWTPPDSVLTSALGPAPPAAPMHVPTNLVSPPLRQPLPAACLRSAPGCLAASSAGCRCPWRRLGRSPSASGRSCRQAGPGGVGAGGPSGACRIKPAPLKQPVPGRPAPRARPWHSAARTLARVQALGCQAWCSLPQLLAHCCILASLLVWASSVQRKLRHRPACMLAHSDVKRDAPRPRSTWAPSSSPCRQSTCWAACWTPQPPSPRPQTTSARCTSR